MMTWPFENDTSAVVRKIAKRSFHANKVRNVIAIIAIILTSILFTSLFTLGLGMKESARIADMILSGGDRHAQIIEMNDDAYAAISSHPLIREISYCRKLADSVDNTALAKRQTFFEYYDDLGLKYMFIEPTSGHRPMAENEVIMDSNTMELLGVPREIGAEIVLELTVHNQTSARNFVLSGWWESYPGVQYGTIVGSEEYMQAHADELLDTKTITAGIKFEDTKNIDEDLETVIKDSGYTTESSAQNYLNAGANPLYLSMETSNHMGTTFALLLALATFLLSGYLIIYNIFQISILRDLHFYGLLKTIGATGRQINSIVRKQVWKLSVIGIPIGLGCGFIIGWLLLPVLVKNSRFLANTEAVSFNPVIFIAAAVFAMATVALSVWKPARIAARVSPIEAIRYTDSDVVMRGKQKRRSRSGKPQKRMAWSNLGRNKKRTALVILSLSVSMILTSIVFTFSHSVNPEKALKNMMDSDFSIGQSSLFDYYKVSEESALSESFIQKVQAQNGFETGGAEYGCTAVYRSETTTQTVNMIEDGTFSTHIYGLDEYPFSQLQLVDGELDVEKLMSGQYILEGAFVTTRGVMDEESLNHAVGDKVELECGGHIQEFTVLGHVIANETNTYDWSGSCFFFPSDVYVQFTGNRYPMSYKFDVADDAEDAMETFLKEYTNTVETEMTYRSKNTVMAGVNDIQNTVILVGGTLAFIIGFIGVLNFVNTMLTSIFTRRRELATLQSIGMSSKQVVKMLCREGSNYAVISLVSSVPVSFAVAFLVVRPICEQVWFLDFKMNIWPLVIIFFLLFAVSVTLPYVTYQKINKESIVERLKCGE